MEFALSKMKMNSIKLMMHWSVITWIILISLIVILGTKACSKIFVETLTNRDMFGTKILMKHCHMLHHWPLTVWIHFSVYVHWSVFNFYLSWETITWTNFINVFQRSFVTITNYILERISPSLIARNPKLYFASLNFKSVFSHFSVWVL